MAQIPHKSSNVSSRKIGLECSHGFGDGLFNAPLAKAVSEQFDTPVGIAVKQSCADAYYNLPWVDEIIIIPEMGYGERRFVQLNYAKSYQITPNVWFYEFLPNNPGMSLIDVPTLVGRMYGFHTFDPKPIFIPTNDELNTPNLIEHVPIIAIESVFNSGQSWASQADFDYIIQKYAPTHKILWLSHQGHPNHPRVIDTKALTRRQLIMCLQRAEIFFSVGSAFFCASLALPPEHQPKRIVCLWTDNLYKYEHRLSQTNWHNNITWVHNSNELRSL